MTKTLLDKTQYWALSQPFKKSLSTVNTDCSQHKIFIPLIWGSSTCFEVREFRSENTKYYPCCMSIRQLLDALTQCHGVSKDEWSCPLPKLLFGLKHQIWVLLKAPPTTNVLVFQSKQSLASCDLNSFKCLTLKNKNIFHLKRKICSLNYLRHCFPSSAGCWNVQAVVGAAYTPQTYIRTYLPSNDILGNGFELAGY